MLSNKPINCTFSCRVPELKYNLHKQVLHGNKHLEFQQRTYTLLLKYISQKQNHDAKYVWSKVG